MSLAEQKAAEEAARELKGLIDGVKADVQANGGQVRDLAGKVQAIESKIQAVTQAQDALNRASFDRSHSGGTNRELDVYTKSIQEHDVQAAPNAYFHDPGRESRDRVRLLGHDTLRQPGNPRSRVKVWGLFDDPRPRNDWQRKAQQLLDKHNLVVHHLNSGRMDPGGQRERAWQCEAELLDHLQNGPEQIGKIFSNVSGQGAEWIPSQPVPELERAIYFQPSRWQIFPRLELTHAPIVRPRRSGFLRTYLGAVPATDDPAADPLLSSWTTTNQTINVIEFATGSQYHLNANEDSIVAFEPEIRQDMALGHVWAIENAITSGDTTASHMDAIALWDTRGRLGTSGLGLANDQRRAWIGLRKFARSLTSMTTDAGAAALTTDMMTTDLGKIHPESLLGSEGRVRVVIEISPETFFSTVIKLPEFSSFDDVGILASLVTGQVGDLSLTPGGLLPNQVGFLYGRFPVLINYTITKDYAATGLYTGSGATTGTLTYDVSRFQFVNLAGMTIKDQEDIRNNTRTLVSRQRCNFVSKDDAGSTVKTCHWRYNVSA